MQISTTHSAFDQYTPTASVTKLLVIQQLLHPAPKSTVIVPWHNFNLCPFSQQILATSLVQLSTSFAGLPLVCGIFIGTDGYWIRNV